nr:methyl-accepting chemotaxis protein [Pseudomonas sp. Q2-TVG4-2]
MNIDKKLTLAFVTISCVPILLVAAVVIYNLRTQAEADFLDGSVREIRQISNSMNVFFKGISENVDYLTKEPQIVAAPLLKDYSSADAPSTPLPETNQAIESIFDRFAKSHPTTAYLSYGRVDGGYAIWPGDPDLKSYDPRVRPWYKTAIAAPGKTLHTAAYYWAPDDAVLIGTVRTVNDNQGNLAGVVGVDVSLRQLTDMVKQIKIGQTGYLMLVEGSGNVLVDPSNSEHNFKSLADLGGDYAKMAGIEGLAEVELNGTRYMANVWTSPTLGWHFIGLIERSEVMAKANALAWQIGVIVLILAVIFAFVGALFAKLIVSPIRSVASGLENIAQGEGDLTRSLVVQGKDETASLARWFNQFLGAIRQLVQRIIEASAALRLTSEGSTRVAQDMTDVAERQRGAVEMVSTAFNEMVATANEVARSCSAAATSADDGQRQAHAGQAQIEAATESVTRLSENLKQSAMALQTLEQDSQNINAILSTISSIAEQTNLLALNAAIEAARAGDQGRGFAVVADEVRALAKRTADSTGEIDSLLGGLARQTQEVTRQMQNSLKISQASVEGISLASQSFEQIRGAVDHIRDQNTQIATAAEEQHQVAEEINRHVAQIQDDALLVENLAQSAHRDSEELAQLSEQLQSLVGRFRT